MTSTVFALVVGGVITSAAFGCPGSIATNSTPSDGTDRASAAAKIFAPTPAFARINGGVTIADVAEKCVASVVNIASEKVIKMDDQLGPGPLFNDPFFRHFFGPGFDELQRMPRERREKSLGSGVIVSGDGIVLTNHHVIERADKIQVALADGREFAADVIGTDPETDVAVLRLKGNGVSDLQPIRFGSSTNLRLGDLVLAVGDPFGVGQTVTMGIVSAKGRANVGIVDYEDFIQTDAAINPGNSGGALVDMNGNLVGINTAIISRSGGYQGIGFAIPSEMAQSIMNSLLNSGKVVRGWLGVAIQDVDENLAEALDLGGTKGVLISDVNAGSPAEAAGLKRGDVVIRINGEAIDSTGKLRNIVAIAGAKAKIEVDVVRDGQHKKLNVVLGEKTADRQQVEIAQDQGALGGLTLGALTAELRDKFRIPRQLQHGAVVLSVAQGSPAQRAGFRPGDVIREMNRTAVTSVSEFAKRYKEAQGPVAFLIQRGATTLYLAMRKP